MGRPPLHFEAIAWKYRTNSPWRDLPDELGSFQTAHKRLVRWAVDGTWEMILAADLAAADTDEDIEPFQRGHQSGDSAPQELSHTAGEGTVSGDRSSRGVDAERAH